MAIAHCEPSKTGKWEIIEPVETGGLPRSDIFFANFMEYATGMRNLEHVIVGKLDSKRDSSKIISEIFHDRVNRPYLILHITYLTKIPPRGRKLNFINRIFQELDISAFFEDIVNGFLLIFNTPKDYDTLIQIIEKYSYPDAKK